MSDNEEKKKLINRLRKQASKEETNGNSRKASELRRKIYDLTHPQ